MRMNVRARSNWRMPFWKCVLVYMWMCICTYLLSLRVWEIYEMRVIICLLMDIFLNIYTHVCWCIPQSSIGAKPNLSVVFVTSWCQHTVVAHNFFCVSNHKNIIQIPHWYVLLSHVHRPSEYISHDYNNVYSHELIGHRRLIIYENDMTSIYRKRIQEIDVIVSS